MPLSSSSAENRGRPPGAKGSSRKSPAPKAGIVNPGVAAGINQRQAAVLEAALGLLVEGGERAITTAGIARAANCSKESLYKWFGDRDGILAAMIAYQARKVRVPGLESRRQDGASNPRNNLRADLTAFGNDLLSVLAGPTSLALNRLAIGQSDRENSRLGGLLVARGRRVIEEGAITLLAQAQQDGALSFTDERDCFHTLYGLIVADMHVRLLLGADVPEMTQEKPREAHVQRAVDRFLILFGPAPGTAQHITDRKGKRPGTQGHGGLN